MFGRTPPLNFTTDHKLPQKNWEDAMAKSEVTPEIREAIKDAIDRAPGGLSAVESSKLLRQLKKAKPSQYESMIGLFIHTLKR